MAGGAQVQAAKQLVQTPENDAGLSVSVVNTDAPGSAKAYAYDGIAIGNNSVAGQEPKLKFDKNGQPVMKDGKQERESQGNGHVAIGLMARATGQGAPGNQASVAVGAYALAKGAAGTALGAQSIANGLASTAIGIRAQADESHSVALGEESKAAQRYSIAVGYKSKSAGFNTVAIGSESLVNSGDSIAIGNKAQVKAGSQSVTVGANTTISSSNVSTLGANITVDKGRNGAVVLGDSSDGGRYSPVIAVNSATVNGLVYSGFKGNLGGTNEGGKNKASDDFGRFVSVGEDTQEVKTTTKVTNGVKTTTIIKTSKITGKELEKTVITSTIANGKEKITTEITSTYLVKNSDGTIKEEKRIERKPEQNKGTNAQPHQDAAENTVTKIVYGERQIKHVAAGEITTDSTDAINGSQLYAVASGLRDSSPMVYTDKDGNKLLKYPDGNYYPENSIPENAVIIDGKYYPAGTVKIDDKYYPAGTTAENKANAQPVEAIPAVTDVVVSMKNPGKPDTGKENTAGNKVTLTNVAPGAKTIIAPDKDKDGNLLTKVGNKYYKADQLKADGQPKENAETSTKVENTPVEKAKEGLADLDNSVSSNALTVADAKNLGWVVSVGKDGKDYADKVINANEVRFNGTDGIKVTGETKGGVRHINISLEKGAVVKQDEYTIEGKTYVSIDGKLYNKDDVDFSGDKPKAKDGTQPSSYIVKDSKVINSTTPDNPVDAKVDKADHFVDGNTVYTAIQKSGWTVGKATNVPTDDKFKNEDEKINPNDELRFADGKGITVKTATIEKTNEDGSTKTTTVVKFDADLPIDYANVTDKNAAGEKLKQAKDGNWYKEADVNADGTVKLTDNKPPKAEERVKTGITFSDSNSDMGKNPYRTAIEDKAMAAAIKKVRAENPNATAEELLPKVLAEADKQVTELQKDVQDTPQKGTGGVQLNNVGWAENPDQAVNKDQLDQTVNKSGFTVKLNDGNTTDGNKTDGSLLSTPEKVTPNDVINFKNGKGTTIKAVTKRENGVDTTTVSVDVDSSASPIVYTDGAGKELKKEGDKYYRNDDVKDAVKIGDKFYKNGTTEDDVNKGKAEEIKAVEKVIASIPGNSGNPASLKVGDGNVSSDSKEAVNGKQLHETNVLVDKNTQAINAINNAINNQSGAFDRLERKINKQGKEARAGIAGANAAAALPQVYTPGKSMVAASAGTFKGQNALAVGYSRASDNGKVILKLQGNANTSGDVGAGVGVGYQW